MRGAWGKPYGTVARVNIGQIILSIRCKEANAPVVMEALRRARYKFPGRQKIIVSKKWGFTNVNKEEYLRLKEEKRVLQSVSLPFQFFCPIKGRDQRLNRLCFFPSFFFAGMVPMCNTFAHAVLWSRTCATN
jgi:large subunit ribosomal protein L10e